MKQERKRSPKGARTQKMFTFRIDLENLEWLNKFENKGRTINQIIEMFKEKHPERY